MMDSVADAATASFPLCVQVLRKAAIEKEQQKILRMTVSPVKDFQEAFKTLFDLARPGAHTSTQPLPYCAVELKILTYCNDQRKKVSQFFFVVKPIKGEQGSPQWWALTPGQIDALEALNPILKESDRSWPLWSEDWEKKDCGCLAIHAAQLMKDAETFALDESETGEEVLIGKKLAFKWLKEWQAAKELSRTEQGVKQNLKLLFTAFISVQKGKIQFTEKEFAPFAASEEKLGFGTICNRLRRRETIPSVRAIENFNRTTSSISSMPPPAQSSSLTPPTATPVLSASSSSTSTSSATSARAQTNNSSPKPSGSFVMRVVGILLWVTGMIFVFRRWQNRTG